MVSYDPMNNQTHPCCLKKMMSSTQTADKFSWYRVMLPSHFIVIIVTYNVIAYCFLYKKPLHSEPLTPGCKDFFHKLSSHASPCVDLHNLWSSHVASATWVFHAGDTSSDVSRHQFSTDVELRGADKLSGNSVAQNRRMKSYMRLLLIIMNAQKSPVWKVGSPSKLRCTNSWPHQIDSMVFVFGWPTNLEQNVMALRCGNFGDLLNGSRCQTMSRPLRPRPLKWIQDPTSNIIQGCSNVGNVQALEISCHWYHEGSQGLGNV